MSPKSLGILAVVTAVAVVLAWGVSGSVESGSRFQEEALAAYPRFEGELNDVVSVEITGHDASFTVEKGPDGWGLREKSGYPVDFERVRDVVVRLSELEPLEAKTARPERWSRLGLQPPSEEGSPAKRVVLRDASGDVVSDLVIGSTKFKGRTATLFVRPGEGEQAYQCEGRINFEADPLAWIDREVLRLDNSKVASVQIEHPEGELVRIEATGDPAKAWRVADVPTGMQETHDGVGNAPATALSFLRLDDVRPRKEVDFSQAPRCKATYACKDGLVITVELAELEEGTWARMDAAFEPPAEDSEVAPEDASHAEIEARSLQRTFERWAYRLPDFKADSICKRASDLLIETPAEETDEAVPAEASAEGDEGAVEEADADAAAEDGGADGDEGAESSGR